MTDQPPTLEALVADRQIKEVVHFTTHHGLLGCLYTGHLLSRPLLKEENYLSYLMHPNSKWRSEESAHFDKEQDWIRYVNLSITDINRSFFNFSSGWPHNAEMWWAILSFSPEILTHDGVFFATTNNSYDGVRRACGPPGFQALFADRIECKSEGKNGRPWNVWRGRRPMSLTTCEQAEVLYPDKVSLDFLRKVYVRTDENYDAAAGWVAEYGHETRGVDVIVDPDKFNGRPN